MESAGEKIETVFFKEGDLEGDGAFWKAGITSEAGGDAMASCERGIELMRRRITQVRDVDRGRGVH